MKLSRHETREIEAGVDEEIRFHVEMRAEELVRMGHAPDEARAEALRRFGDLAATRAACVDSDRRRHRAHRRREMVRALGADARFALRRMRRRPLAFAVIILTLGVGIGASTAVFSVAEHVLWRPLPVADEDQVLTLWETDPQQGGARLEVSPGNFASWEQLQRSFVSLGLAYPSGFDHGRDGAREAVNAWRVTRGFLDALGAAPHLGRLFVDEDFARDAPGAGPAVVVSHAFWRDRLGADPAAVGRSIELDGAPSRVVGVMPPDLDYPRRQAAIWAPTLMSDHDRTDHASRYTQVVARLRAGVTPAAAQADMDRVAGLVHAQVAGAPTGGVASSRCAST